MSKSHVSGVRVLCRFRPFNANEIEHIENQNVRVEFDGAGAVHIRYLAQLETTEQFGKQSTRNHEVQSFSFDLVFNQTSTQANVYEKGVQFIVNDVLNGFNGTVFAYGQTGSGKTHTMLGTFDPQVQDSELWGVIPRASHEILSKATTTDDVEFTITASYLEIYKEKIRDLLDPARKNLPIRESPIEGVYVQHLSSVHVHGIADVWSLLTSAEQNKARAATKMNAQSSRSHSVLSLNVSQRNPIDGTVRVGRLKLVDLAGSEKVQKTGASGETLEQAKKINKSLSALGNCIFALTSRRSHVPYRDSKLTRILQESLGGNTKTTLIVCCSPHEYNLEETLSTLRFAQRAKLIKNAVKANVHLSVAVLEEIIRQLRAELVDLGVYTRGLELTIDWMLSSDYHEGDLSPFAVPRPRTFDPSSLPPLPPSDSAKLLPAPPAGFVLSAIAAGLLPQPEGGRQQEGGGMAAIGDSSSTSARAHRTGANGGMDDEDDDFSVASESSLANDQSALECHSPLPSDNKTSQFLSPVAESPTGRGKSRFAEDASEQANGSSGNDNSELEALREALAREREATKALLAAAQNKEETSSRRAWEAEAQLAIVRGSLVQARTQHDATVLRLESEAAEARASLESAEEMGRQKDATIAALTCQITESESQRKSMMERHIIEVDLLQQRIKVLEMGQRDIESKYSLAAAKLQLLEEQRSANGTKSNSECGECEHRLTSLGTVRAELEMHRVQVTCLHQVLADAATKQADAVHNAAVARRELQTVQQRNNELESRIHALDAVLLEMEQLYSDGEKDRECVKEALVNFSQQVDDVKAVLSSSSTNKRGVAELEQEVTHLTKELETLRITEAMKVDALEAAQKHLQTSLAAAHERAEELQKCCDSMRGQSQVVDSSTASSANLQRQRDEVQEETHSVREELQRTRQELVAAQESAMAAREKLEQAEEKQAVATQELAAKKAELQQIVSVSTRVQTSLRGEVQRAMQRVAQAEGSAKGFQLQLSALKALLHGGTDVECAEALGGALEATRASLAAAEARAEGLEEEVKRLRVLDEAYGIVGKRDSVSGASDARGSVVDSPSNASRCFSTPPPMKLMDPSWRSMPSAATMAAVSAAASAQQVLERNASPESLERLRSLQQERRDPRLTVAQRAEEAAKQAVADALKAIAKEQAENNNNNNNRKNDDYNEVDKENDRVRHELEMELVHVRAMLAQYEEQTPALEMALAKTAAVLHVTQEELRQRGTPSRQLAAANAANRTPVRKSIDAFNNNNNSFNSNDKNSKKKDSRRSRSNSSGECPVQ